MPYIDENLKYPLYAHIFGKLLLNAHYIKTNTKNETVQEKLRKTERNQEKVKENGIYFKIAEKTT